MATKAEMDASREAMRQIIYNRPEYKDREVWSTNDASHWIQKSAAITYHHLCTMETEGIIMRVDLKSNSGGKQPTRWIKVSGKSPAKRFRNASDEEIGIPPITFGQYRNW